jgi:hypothetical protein
LRSRVVVVVAIGSEHGCEGIISGNEKEDKESNEVIRQGDDLLNRRGAD